MYTIWGPSHVVRNNLLGQLLRLDDKAVIICFVFSGVLTGVFIGMGDILGKKYPFFGNFFRCNFSGYLQLWAPACVFWGCLQLGKGVLKKVSYMFSISWTYSNNQEYTLCALRSIPTFFKMWVTVSPKYGCQQVHALFSADSIWFSPVERVAQEKRMESRFNGLDMNEDKDTTKLNL
ncbi:hypothetical protein DFH06DRAFT_1136008 [Mycena polygramma]|nr:hypothetical protein DFH06DRAFT_1136008 [Mycena polygramma]